MTRRILKFGLTAALIAAALPASSALGGQYHVYSCRTPGGEAAPVDGWSGVLGSGGAYDDYTLNTCAQGGALISALGDETKHMAGVDSATWEFSVPPNRTLTAATLWRAGDTSGGAVLDAAYQFWFASPAPSNSFDECLAGIGCHGSGDSAQPFAEENRIVVPPERLGSNLYSIAACGGQAKFECPAGKGDANGYAAAVYIYAADMTLEQTAGPTVSAVGGELPSAASLAGTSDLTFNAADPGAGVYEAVFSIDGNVLQRTVIDEQGGRCRNVGGTSDGLPAFLYLQPCPPSVSADIPFNTAGIANGSHHLTVTVTDAAGNSAPVLDRTVTIANPVIAVPGPANGQGSSGTPHLEARWNSTPKTLLTTGYGHSQRITGRLLNEDGTAISGASIEASYKPSYGGAKTTALAAGRTGVDGRFTLSLPSKASSETVELFYRGHIGDVTPAATRTLTLAVRAPVALSVSPHASGVGRTIHFHGRLSGGPLPKGGKPLVLEARAGHSGWIEFDVLRSDSHGRFHASYRFKFPGPVHYQFRVLCEREADYPYATGSSRVAKVFEH